MNKINLLILFFILTISCNKNHENIMNNNDQLSNNKDTVKVIVDTASVFKNSQIEEYKRNVISKGDPDSFTKLIIHYGDLPDYKELNKYALIMADKYNSGDGYNMVFESIIAMNNNEYYDITDLAKINEKAKNEALKYLEKGASINDINCMSKLQEIYRNGIGVHKDIKKADELKRKMEVL